MQAMVREAQSADVVVKASGVGVLDDELVTAVLGGNGHPIRIYWDVDAAATLSAIDAGAEGVLRHVLPKIDGVFTYGGGPRAVNSFHALGARACWPIYNALDPETHSPGQINPTFAADLAFLGNRQPAAGPRGAGRGVFTKTSSGNAQ
jgi:spore maturation protein CgeB